MKPSSNQSPLADRLRPTSLEEFFGQEEIVRQGSLIRRSIETGALPSLIFWGPPGSGKTTLALIIAKMMAAEFIRFSAVTQGVADLRKVIDRAKENQILDKKTILFIDEIHRWNKAQQDALLPHIENGTIILIGATTENPSFEIRNALLSRCRVIVLNNLSPQALEQIIRRAIKEEKFTINEEAINFLVGISQGDARAALNILEAAQLVNQEIDLATIKQAAQKSHLLYDKDGEEHYNIISALHKSLRGSDEDAALYWLARMLEAGEDPMYVARRLVRFSAEDVGLANSHALEQAVAAYQACHDLGMPECNIVLAQLVVYLARCQKSNAIYSAYLEAASDARSTSHLGVPLHLRNAPTTLMKDLGYGKDYKYSPDFAYQEEQNYWPDNFKAKKYLDKKKSS